jgi:hypothetical protein
MFARPAGSLIAMNIVPGSLDVRSARVRARFRKAVIAALGRYGRVRSFATVRELISAARAPQCEERPLLH